MRSSLARRRYVKVTWVSPMDSTRYAPSSVSPSLIGNTLSPLDRSTDWRPPLYQLPSIPVWHRRRGWCRSRRGRCRDLRRRRLPRTRREELRAEFSKLRTLRQCERNRAATASGLRRAVRRQLNPTCRALHPGGIKDDKPQRSCKHRKQARLSHPCTHLKHFIEPATGHARCDHASSLVRLGQGGCSRATTSDRRVATIKSGFRDSGSRLEPLLWNRVGVFPSFLPNRHLPRPAVRPGFFLSGQIAPRPRSQAGHSR